LVTRWVVDAKLKSGLLAAIRARAPSALVRRVSPMLLLQLSKPAPLILSGAIDEDFGPGELLSLRRSNPGPVRFSPAVIVGAASGDVDDWLLAGGLPIRSDPTPEKQIDLIEEALRECPPWVVSTVYVGPCRRRRRPLVLLNPRRATDKKKASPRKRGGYVGDDDISPALLPRLHRRMMCAVVAIETAPVERRRDFLDILVDLENAARGSGDGELVASIQRLQDASRKVMPPARFEPAAFESALSDVNTRLSNRAAAIS
jgi:hypothetical protein